MHSYTEAGILIFHYLKNVSFTTEPTVLLAYKVVPFFLEKKNQKDSKHSRVYFLISLIIKFLPP